MSQHTDAPVGVGAAAVQARRTRRAVHAAIASGRLPAQRMPVGGGRFVYLLRPADVARVWPNKKVA